MEAKDTVMTDADITDAIQEAERLSWTHKPHPIYEKQKYLLQIQAEISFRAGQDSREPDVRELKNQIAGYKAQSTLTYCIYCGATFPLDDEAGTKVTEHINSCEKHPLFQARQEVAKARLAGIKEVVEWIQSNKLFALLDNEDRGNSGLAN